MLRGVLLIAAAVLLMPLCLGCGTGSTATPASGKNGSNATETPPVELRADDPRIIDATGQARNSVEDFIKALENPQPGMRGFVVKMRFVDGGQTEFMWIDRLRYSGGQFYGTLTAAPVLVNNVAQGETYSVAKEDIIDWAFYQNDTMVGGYTEKVIRQIRSVEQRKASKPATP